MSNEQERWWDSPTFTGQTDDAGNPLFSDDDVPEEGEPAEEAEGEEAGPEATPEEPLEPHAETTPSAAGGYAHGDPPAAPTPEVPLEPSSAVTHAAAESEAEHAPFDQ